MLEGFNTPDGKMEKIYFSEENKDQILALLQDVEGFDKSYFLDDNIDKIKLPDFFKPTALLPDDRALIERGHKTLIRFIELCLSDIAHESKIVAESMNPYYLYKDVSISANVGALLSDEDMQTAVTAFKNGTVYKALISSNFTKIFSKLDVGSMHILVDTLEKDINKSLGEDVSTDLKKFSLKLGSGYNSAADAIHIHPLVKEILRVGLPMVKEAH